MNYTEIQNLNLKINTKFKECQARCSIRQTSRYRWYSGVSKHGCGIDQVQEGSEDRP
jgi:hypothetical protein